MPKRLTGRTITAEDDLAERITHERERRGWSYERLAREMTKAGCKTHASAVHKIEKGEPRRRITVTELVGISRALDLPVEDLLRPLAAVLNEELTELDGSVRAAEQAAFNAVHSYAEWRQLLQVRAAQAATDEAVDRVLHLMRERHEETKQLLELVRALHDAGAPRDAPDLADEVEAGMT